MKAVLELPNRDLRVFDYNALYNTLVTRFALGHLSKEYVLRVIEEGQKQEEKSQPEKLFNHYNEMLDKFHHEHLHDKDDF